MEQLPALIMVLKLLKSIVYPSEKMIIISFGVFMILCSSTLDDDAIL
jgi:hypothetical protein